MFTTKKLFYIILNNKHLIEHGKGGTSLFQYEVATIRFITYINFLCISKYIMADTQDIGLRPPGLLKVSFPRPGASDDVITPAEADGGGGGAARIEALVPVER